MTAQNSPTIQAALELLSPIFGLENIEIKNLTGGHSHLHVGLTISSSLFDGKTRVEQHQMVMDLLKEQLKEDIHALHLKTIVKKGDSQ